ncbi:MAG TPA: type 2 isopentenyl-diphosphate Delta-isomerase [Anaerolinea thermolimosa]|uniref:Isopentenyl-diphosphate delta-isomerase n=1 Tax=Anaerolinea thermolimosa TaxID=229919 RepID=A0A3D1JGX9_9CHLR|nr:type 2 isopentenyl-diphosphate Delta-isomerase [Anaerolinea thermolimosa]GAP06992.1 isopentenyl-diphosphate delta-isomerase [Anaerolinea thermolimosa]HCE17497.1 type 2 isopentenyl-diphosphate Delta-isomerase [Anaerolinea thermolimosa]
MPDTSFTSSRKADHIRINLEEDVQSGLTTGLERYRFVHEALPEIDFEQIDCSVSVFGRQLNAPVLISSMTGGTDRAGMINRLLAEAAQQCGVAMGVGSQRAALENPELQSSFQVRSYAPDILLLANLGAVQLNYGYTVDECKRAVEMIEADGLILHLNSMQEAIQPEGDTRFAGLARKIEKVCRELSVPVVVKEVGWGISKRTARLLAEAGVAAIDVAGAGGTSWTQVEMYRLPTERQRRVAAAFRRWGIPTSESISMVRQAAPDVLVFASGGLRDGVDIAKCIALGATLGGMAGPFLKAANQSVEEVVDTIEEISREIRICMFGVGAASLRALSETPLIREGEA